MIVQYSRSYFRRECTFFSAINVLWDSHSRAVQHSRAVRVARHYMYHLIRQYVTSWIQVRISKLHRMLAISDALSIAQSIFNTEILYGQEGRVALEISPLTGLPDWGNKVDLIYDSMVAFGTVTKQSTHHFVLNRNHTSYREQTVELHVNEYNRSWTTQIEDCGSTLVQDYTISLERSMPSIGQSLSKSWTNSQIIYKHDVGTAHILNFDSNSSDHPLVWV